MDADADPEQLVVLGAPREVLRLARSLTRSRPRDYALRRVDARTLARLGQHSPLLLALRRLPDAPATSRAPAQDPLGLCRGASREIMPLIGRRLADVERELLLGTLGFCHGNRTYAAQLLGISVRTMRNKLRAMIDEGVAVIPPSHPALTRASL